MHDKSIYGKIMSFSCISNMDSNHQTSLMSLFDHYAPTLDGGAVKRDTAYTPHDFSRHCYNLYDIISNILLNDGSYPNLSSEDLFTLNTAVLLHDYSMTKSILNRNMHQLESIEMLKDEYYNSGNKSTISSTISEKVFDGMCKLIKAHSNIKNGDEINTIETFECKNKDDEKLKVLAGLLRLADELDITSARLYKFHEDDLRKLILSKKSKSGLTKTEKDELEDDEYSLECWSACSYVLRIYADSIKHNQINVEINDEKLKTTGDTSIFSRIIENVKIKKEKEFKLFNDNIYDTIELTSKITKNWKSVNVVSKQIPQNIIEHCVVNSAVSTQIPKNITEYYDDNRTVHLKQSDNAAQIDNAPDKTDLTEAKFEVIDSHFCEKINNWVLKEHILFPGHYLLNDKYCSRDWIDISGILENQSKRTEIKDMLTAHFSKTFDVGNCDYVLIGLDYNGMLLASLMAIDLNLPYTFIVPIHKERQFASVDVELNLPDKDTKLILVCDVIASGHTISQMKSAIEKNEHHKVIAVYSVLYRKPNNQQNELNSLFDIYTLNNEFEIEIVESNKCNLKTKDNCIAINKVAY